jgi:dephospho-CoA kinase
MLKVGLTGSYNSGYEQVAEILEENGIPIFDADVILKFMINYSDKHIKKIKSKFGDNIYNYGLLDIKKLENTKSFDDLLDIVQLDLIKSYEKWRMKNWNCFYTIFKSSILYERGIDTSMNFTINTFRPKQKRRYDLSSHNSMPISRIDEILNGEMGELVKNGKATYVIHNYHSDSYDTTEDYIKSQIKNINKSLVNKDTRTSHNIDTYGNVSNILSY